MTLLYAYQRARVCVHAHMICMHQNLHYSKLQVPSGSKDLKGLAEVCCITSISLQYVQLYLIITGALKSPDQSASTSWTIILHLFMHMK